MPLYGGNRDIGFFKGLNKELLHKIIEQQVGYYKPKLEESTTNVYGEALNKFWIGPVLIKCLIDRGDFEWSTDEFGPDNKRSFSFRFLKDDLINVNVVPEVGDVVLWNEGYFEVNALNENQLIVGKDPDYAYSDNVTNHGSSLSIILQAHYARPEKLGIKQDRL
jgi:hypothetical protein